MILKCFCDHCPNNTCTLQDGGVCWAQYKLDKNGEIEKKYNCFDKDNSLIQSLLCDGSLPTATSSEIRRCCNNADYCNQNATLLPNLEQAKQLLAAANPRIGGSSALSLTKSGPAAAGRAGEQNFKATSTDDLSPATSIISSNNINSLNYKEYSSIPLEYKLLIIVLSGLLLIFALALVQNYFTRRRKQRQRVPNKRSPSPPRTTITTTSTIELSTSTRASLMRGPYMSAADDTYPTGRAPSTFQMTIGSGIDASKPETSSGSGAGQPYLTQRSIAHDIELREVVGRGYFGVVWRGEYKGEPVAVKIFAPMAEPSWEREAEIYQTTMLRHKNILGFIATDKRYDSAVTGFWLVTDYYPMGSLYDFLRENSMSMTDAVRMAFSIANGLAHLHTEIFGAQGKPAIAHRDLKSKNVLVKNDGTCCVGDLGMAVRYNSSTGVVDVPANTRVGTRRYLAPELIENRLNLMDFDAVKAADVYSLGLVLWEVLRRACLVQPPVGSPTSDPAGGFSASASNESAVLSSALMSQQQQQQQQQPPPPPPPQAMAGSRTTGSPASPPGQFRGGLARTARSRSGSPQSLSSEQLHKQQAPLLAREHAPTNPTYRQQEESPNFELTMFPDQFSSVQQPLLAESMETSVEDTSCDLAMLCDPYEAPYQQYVSNEVTNEEMREVVCVRKIRPQISVRWTKFAPMRDYVTLMSECWYEKPQARLSALRIRKSLGDIARHYFNLNMEYD